VPNPTSMLTALMGLVDQKRHYISDPGFTGRAQKPSQQGHTIHMTNDNTLAKSSEAGWSYACV
jgi:hypothetical protein